MDGGPADRRAEGNVLRTGCLQAVTSVAGSGHLPAETLAERLMLAIYAYGTNCGIRSVASAEHQVIKYATAIKNGTASTEAVLSRFTRTASHPAYQAMLEIGRAQRTIFAARYLLDRDLQREIEEGLNVVEAWNGANAVICYSRGGEISTNRREEVEMTALCLRILQAALVYVNTLMLQHVLAEQEWARLLGPADRRGLTPLFWQHVRPYGEVRLDMGSRLSIGAPLANGS